MTPVQKPRLYLAGPEVFLPDAMETAAKQKAICEEHGFTPLHPLDNNAGSPLKIYIGNVEQIRACHIVVASCRRFRGPHVDDGTAGEIARGSAWGKACYGYMSPLDTLIESVARLGYSRDSSGHFIDSDGYRVEDFDLSHNLMIIGDIYESGGRLVGGDFEVCIKAIRHDIDSGRLILPIR